MQPTLVSRPFHREGLVYEEKVDGYRMVAHNTLSALAHTPGLRPKGMSRPLEAAPPAPHSAGGNWMKAKYREEGGGYSTAPWDFY